MRDQPINTFIAPTLLSSFNATQQINNSIDSQTTKTSCLPVEYYYNKSESKQETIPEILERTCQHGNDGLAFMAIDLGEPIRKLKTWKNLLPNVDPFYAVKCNSDIAILKTLVEFMGNIGGGGGFDCASKEEISIMLKLGVDPERIIFANPCKPITHIQYAARNGVEMMTFDNEDELLKIKEYHPTAKLVLRVLADDSKSSCRFGIKFGASTFITKHLLETAFELGLQVIGVSFHVGSGCFDPTAYRDAISIARKVFEEGKEIGFRFTLLDIGGGFPGVNHPEGATFEEIACVIRESLSEIFPLANEEGIRFIAEPGRYVVTSSCVLAVNITSRRVILPEFKNTPTTTITKPEEKEKDIMYYVNDGVYGSLNCILFDHATKVEPKVLVKDGDFLFGHNEEEKEKVYETSIWGPTCDSLDCITRNVRLPELHVGDWLYFENMGAYTIAASTTFNGFPKPIHYYTNTEL